MSKSKLFFDVASSLDGFIAPEGMELAHANDPEFNQWMSQWTKLQNWVFHQQFFRKNLKLGDGGETGGDNRMLEETFNRTGVSIMGKRMFEGGRTILAGRSALSHTSLSLDSPCSLALGTPRRHHVLLRQRWNRGCTCKGHERPRGTGT